MSRDRGCGRPFPGRASSAGCGAVGGSCAGCWGHCAECGDTVLSAGAAILQGPGVGVQGSSQRGGLGKNRKAEWGAPGEPRNPAIRRWGSEHKVTVTEAEGPASQGSQGYPRPTDESPQP